ncbi:hypothetical protein NDU88_005120 [Pleurodeles waltl]|uniref:Uncharacterized protein n=1 Tax=Pleurodeles waltl TaxID=8319 RepID=A0AAV7L1E9_PLEWA|nr:hypothetical protein NDU88_005120 [Pleurodeles waltl]
MSTRVPTKAGSSPHPRKSSKDVFSLVVTPGCIPAFTIPSLDIQDNQRHFTRAKAVSWRSHKWHSLDDSQLDRRARRSHSDPTGRQSRGSISCTAEVDQALEDIVDPVTRSALSLPHLAKVTTPYGFVTLGESPQVTHEESVFFQQDLASPKCCSSKRCNCHQMRKRPTTTTMGCGTPEMSLPADANAPKSPREDLQLEDSGNKTSPKSIKDLELSQRWPSRFQCSRRRSSPLVSSCPLERIPNATSIDKFNQQSNSLPKVNPRKPSRNLFQIIIRKHFTKLRQMKSSSLPSH